MVPALAIPALAGSLAWLAGAGHRPVVIRRGRFG